MTQQAPLRLAIVSTPRTGNTWLRHLLGRVWGLEHRAFHEIPQDEWAKLPANCVLQLHALYTPELAARFAAEGFRVITLARHPFDVLISILHVAVHGVESERWLNGLHGDEGVLWGAMPSSRPFREYGASDRAAALFQVTSEWRQAPGVISLRYEDLVRDPAAILGDLEEILGPPRNESIATAVAATSIRQLRHDTCHGEHFWIGKSGLWKELISAPIAEELATALRTTLSDWSYEADADPSLSESQADRRWIELTGPGLRNAIARSSELHHGQLREVQTAIQEWQSHCTHLQVQLTQAIASRDEAHREMHRVLVELDHAQFRLRLITGCGRFALRAARSVQAIMNHLPWVKKAGKIAPLRVAKAPSLTLRTRPG